MSINVYSHIECIECNAEVRARLAYGDEIYPHLSHLHKKTFWKCDVCKNYVGCHPNSENKPLAFIPTAEVRKARKEIHAILDPLWRSKKIRRGQAYKYISNRMGYQYHNGELRDIEESRKAYKIVAKLHNKLNRQPQMPW